MTLVGAEAARLWRLYADHAAVLLRDGPRPSFHANDRWFFATTGSDDLGMNQAALFGGADGDDAETLASTVVTAGVPCLLGCSDGVVERAAPALTAAGFTQLPKREAIFWRPGPPQRREPSPFDVRPVGTAADLAAMRAVFAEVHRSVPASIAALDDGRGGSDGARLWAWLAWDGAEPVSFAVVVEVEGSLSLWEVMTPERHRRRGAARAVVNAALAHAANAVDRPVVETLFWGSPAGWRLYEAMGFVVADQVDTWTIGASAADIAAVGA